MPLSTSRASRHGRPRLSARRGGSGMRGLMRAHCSSVSASRRAIRHLVPQRQGIYETASTRNAVGPVYGCGISADLLYGFERFILQSHRQRAFTELNIVGTRASADRRDGNVVEGTSPSAFVSFRADNYEVTNSGKITVHIDKGVDCAASTSSNRGSFLGIRNDPRTSAALVLLAARVHPRGQAPGMRFALQTSWTLRSFKRAVATDLSRVAITRGVAGAHVRRLGDPYGGGHHASPQRQDRQGHSPPQDTKEETP
jgi:hypothetical protein